MTNTVLDAIKALANENPSIEVAWLYGSQANGTAVAGSDYDIALAFASQLSDKTLNLLRPSEISYSWSKKLDEKISVIDINQAPTPLAYNAISANHVLHCQTPLRQHAEEQRVWSKWEEYKYNHESRGI